MSDLKGLSDSEEILSQPVWNANPTVATMPVIVAIFARWCIVRWWGENAFDELVFPIVKGNFPHYNGKVLFYF